VNAEEIKTLFLLRSPSKCESLPRGGTFSKEFYGKSQWIFLGIPCFQPYPEARPSGEEIGVFFLVLWKQLKTCILLLLLSWSINTVPAGNNSYWCASNFFPLAAKGRQAEFVLKLVDFHDSSQVLSFCHCLRYLFPFPLLRCSYQLKVTEFILLFHYKGFLAFMVIEWLASFFGELQLDLCWMCLKTWEYGLNYKNDLLSFTHFPKSLVEGKILKNYNHAAMLVGWSNIIPQFIQAIDKDLRCFLCNTKNHKTCIKNIYLSPLERRISTLVPNYYKLRGLLPKLYSLDVNGILPPKQQQLRAVKTTHTEMP